MKETNGRRAAKDARSIIGQLDQNLAWDGKTWVNEKETWGKINDESTFKW